MGNACESNALWFVFRGFSTTYPPIQIHGDEVRYIFFTDPWAVRPQVTYCRCCRPMGWTFGKGKCSVTLPSRVGFTPSQFTPQFFSQGGRGGYVFFCWWWWWKDEIRRGKPTERMYKNLPKTERFTISTGVVYFFHQQYVMFKAIRELYIKCIKAF